MDLGLKPLSFTSSTATWKSSNGVFPAGLRVLVVDDDPTCLRILEKMLKNCLYEVTTRNRAELALKFLRDHKNGCDVVISDVHMPDMDGFKLLEHVGLEMDLPVIMMSADASKNVVMKGVTHGACDYLIKPVRMEALKNIWQHVVRKKKHGWRERDPQQSRSVDDGERPDDVDYSSSANDGNWRSSKKRKDEEDEGDEREDSSGLKKPRVVWSVELHQQFVTAVNQLGIDKAVPKKILELMNVPGLTRENVASHLQKYRLYLRRLSGVSQHQNGLGNSFMGPLDMPFGPISSLNGIELQALAASGQLPPQSLATIQTAQLSRTATKSAIPVADQINIFNFENPKLRFVEGQQQQQNANGKQVNLLHGIPTSMDSKQLATLQGSVKSFGSVNIHVPSQSNQSGSVLTQMVQPQLRPNILNKVNGSHFSNLPSSVGSQPVLSIPNAGLHENGMDNVCEFPTNTFSLASNSGVTPKLQDVNSETKRSGGILSNYGAFSDLNHNSRDWHLKHVSSNFEAHPHLNILGVLPSVVIQKNGQSQSPTVNLASLSNTSQQHNSDNSSRVKSERLQDRLFIDNFGQEDLMSALLKQQGSMGGSVENEFGLDGYHLDNLPV